MARGTNPLARIDLGDFIPRVSPRFSRPNHLAPVLNVFERAASGEPVRALISAPPRHGKTEVVLHAIGWRLVRDPSHVTAYVSYEAGFARSKSRNARDYAMAAGVQIRDDADALNEWRTPQGGGCLATGIGGPLTGHGVHTLIVDDPFKNRRDAESATMRDVAHGWFTSTGVTRLEPKGSVIVFHTRWHPDDLIGRLAADRDAGWEVVNLPAISEGEDDPLGRAPGDALWPERWPIDALRAREQVTSPYDWASIYQGRPRPKGGSVFGDPRFYDSIPSGVRYAIGIDLAYTAKTSSDYSCAVVFAEVGGIVYVVDVLRGQMPQPEFADKLAKLRRQHAMARMRAYIAGTERGAVDFAISRGLPIDAIATRADKFVRAQPYAAAWNAGKVLLPREAPWLEAFTLEHQRFTGLRDAHDDQIDAGAAGFDLVITPPPKVIVGGARGFGAEPTDESNPWAGGRGW